VLDVAQFLTPKPILLRDLMANIISVTSVEDEELSLFIGDKALLSLGITIVIC